MEFNLTIIVTIASVTTVYIALLTYVFRRMRKLRDLPPDIKNRMSRAQRVLYLYGLQQHPTTDIQHNADVTLSAFHDAWNEMENVFKQFNNTFEKRRRELAKAEMKIAERHKEEQEQNERLRALNELTPDAAREVSALIQSTSKQALRQQIKISALFFALGSGTTLIFTFLF